MSNSKLYKGIRTMPGYKAVVYADNQILDLNPSKVIHDYGADTVEWGYFGSGPSQTSLAILYDITGDADLAFKYHQDFKYEYIAQFDQNSFILLETQVLAWLEEYRKFKEDL
jgi:hypothetical protein